MAIALIMYSISILPSLPTVEQIQEIPLSYPLRIYSSDNELIAEYGNERRTPVSLDTTPQFLVDALLATEDDQFYHHTGVDFLGITRALVSNLQSGSRGQGASTITMQVARNFFLNPEKTYERKLREILLSFNMERALTKDEILELYLNKIFLGHRAYGFEAAAQVYYEQPLSALSVPQIAMLAGLPKAPSRDNPISNPDRAKERRDYVLRRMYELNFIDEFSYNNAIQSPVTAGKVKTENKIQAPYIAEIVRQYLFNLFGEKVYEKGYSVTVTVDSQTQNIAKDSLRKGLLDYEKRHGYKGPLGSVNLADFVNLEGEQLKQKLNELLNTYQSSRNIEAAIVTARSDQSFSAILENGKRIIVDWEQMKWARPYLAVNSMGPEPKRPSDIVNPGDIVHVAQLEDDTFELTQLPSVGGALVSLDPNTGKVLSLVGGFDYFLSKFNRATQAMRQPGSTIKPFIYSAAFEKDFSPGTLVSAAPIVVDDGDNGLWKPENYSKRFLGPTRIRKALSLSLNLVSVRLLRAIGIDFTIDHLTKFGFNRERLPQGLSLALGTTSVTPLELASSYAIFANGGKQVKPYLIERIVDAEGNRIYPDNLACEPNCEQTATYIAGFGNSLFQSPYEAQQVVSEQNIYLTRSIMQDVIQAGTATRAKSLNRSDIAGKTGTTNDYKDAWFSGFNPDVITTVYVGFDTPSNLGRYESGASAALPIWIDYMEDILPNYTEKAFPRPSGISTAFINKTTGKRTSQSDPEGYYEFFKAGNEPTNQVIENPIGGEIIEDENLNQSLF